jgi:hypothetical protein
MQSNAATVEQYLEELPEERRHAIGKVRDVILANLPDGIEEAMNWGMISYQVPLSVYPDTYNKQPLMYAALASQKNYMSLYLTMVYMSDEGRTEFEKRYRATGKRFDMLKSCVHFRKLEDLPLDLIGETIASIDMQAFVGKEKELRRTRTARRRST